MTKAKTKQTAKLETKAKTKAKTKKASKKPAKEKEIFCLRTNPIAAEKIEQFNKIRNVRDAIKKLESVDFLLDKTDFERVLTAIQQNDYRTLNSIHSKVFHAVCKVLKR